MQSGSLAFILEYSGTKSRFDWGLAFTVLTLGLVSFSSLSAEGPGPATDGRDERAPGKYGLSVYRSYGSISPYEYDMVRNHSAQLVPTGSLRSNTETSFPFSFWYYNETSHLMFEFAASRFVLRQAQYDSLVTFVDQNGIRTGEVTTFRLPVVSRSVETLQVLQPVALGATRLYFGVGLRHLLRQTSASTGYDTFGFSVTEARAFQGTLRWEVPLGASFFAEMQVCTFGGPANYAPAPYLFVVPETQNVSAVVGSRTVRAQIYGGEAALKLRYRIDEHLSLMLGYETGNELRDVSNITQAVISGGPGSGYHVYTRDLVGYGVPIYGTVTSIERFHGYVVGLTLEV